MRTRGWNEELRSGWIHSPEKDLVKTWNLSKQDRNERTGVLQLKHQTKELKVLVGWDGDSLDRRWSWRSMKGRHSKITNLYTRAGDQKTPMMSPLPPSFSSNAHRWHSDTYAHTKARAGCQVFVTVCLVSWRQHLLLHHKLPILHCLVIYQASRTHLFLPPNTGVACIRSLAQLFVGVLGIQTLVFLLTVHMLLSTEPSPQILQGLFSSSRNTAGRESTKIVSDCLGLSTIRQGWRAQSHRVTHCWESAWGTEWGPCCRRSSESQQRAELKNKKGSKGTCRKNRQ